MLAQSTAKSGNVSVRFRKGEKNEKDVFIEVWRNSSSQALRTTLKVTDKMTKVYNDSVFGGISWSHDESKICFIGEVPEPAAFKNPWEPVAAAKKPEADAEEEKKEGEGEGEEKKKKEEEEKKEEHF